MYIVDSFAALPHSVEIYMHFYVYIESSSKFDSGSLPQALACDPFDDSTIIRRFEGGSIMYSFIHSFIHSFRFQRFSL